MDVQNNVTEFILLELLMSTETQMLSCIVFMLCYGAIFIGNLIIFITIMCSHLIQHLMYYFICLLSLMDLSYTSTILPRLVRDLSAKRRNISYNNYMTQLFTSHLLPGVELLILVSVAFDRYVAICKPLYYMGIVTQQRCHMLIMIAWGVAFCHSFAYLLMVLKLPFCGPNEIDHYMCDIKPLLKLICADSYIANILVINNSGLIILVTFMVLLTSYVFIIYNLKKHSAEVRCKALSTCSSHVMVVALFVSCIAIYVHPLSTKITDKEITMFYSLITPLLKPLIYKLRNAEMINARQNVWNKKTSLI